MGKKKRTQEAAKADPFMDASVKSVEFARKHLILVLVVIVAVLGGGALALAWPTMQKQKEMDAVDDLVDARKLLEVPGASQFGNFGMFGQPEPDPAKMQEAVDKLEAVAAEHPGTAAARHALLEAGDTHMKMAAQKKGDEATEHVTKACADYEQVATKGKPDEKYYALSGLGAAHEFRDEWSEAEKAYRRIVNNELLPYRDVATLDLARTLAMQQKFVMARDLLGKFESDFPSSSLKDQAQSRLVMVSGQASAEGTAPAATPSPSPAPSAGESEEAS